MAGNGTESQPFSVTLCYRLLPLLPTAKPQLSRWVPAIHRGAGRGAGHLQLVEVSRPIHAGAGNLSAYERTKLALGRRYNRTKKAVGSNLPQNRLKDQIDPLVTNTAAKLAAEHSALRLVEVPAMPSRIDASASS